MLGAGLRDAAGNLLPSSANNLHNYQNPNYHNGQSAGGAYDRLVAQQDAMRREAAAQADVAAAMAAGGGSGGRDRSFSYNRDTPVVPVYSVLPLIREDEFVRVSFGEERRCVCVPQRVVSLPVSFVPATGHSPSSTQPSSSTPSPFPLRPACTLFPSAALLIAGPRRAATSHATAPVVHTCAAALLHKPGVRAGAGLPAAAARRGDSRRSGAGNAAPAAAAAAAATPAAAHTARNVHLRGCVRASCGPCGRVGGWRVRGCGGGLPVSCRLRV